MSITHIITEKVPISQVGSNRWLCDNCRNSVSNQTTGRLLRDRLDQTMRVEQLAQ